MQIFRVVGATFLVISVLIVVAVGVVPMLRVFGGSGLGGFGAMLVLPSVLTLPLFLDRTEPSRLAIDWSA